MGNKMTDTNNAPERIWIEDEFGEGDDDQWTYGTWDVRNYRGYNVEYVRADLVVAQVIDFLNNQHILYVAGNGRDPEQYSSQFSKAANTLETSARRDKSSTDSNRWEIK